MNISNYAIFRRALACLKKVKGVYFGSRWQNPTSGLASRFIQTVYKHQRLMLVFYCTACAYLNYGGLMESTKVRRLRLSGKANLCQFATLKLAFVSGDLITSSNGGYPHA